ncbi:MORN repeat protein [Leptospira fainei serovar Hurstbridge str. BUT 6]|uniref:MORN repeat protein n=1 Tax=Leptospira fainei serovar Hurstbridge str. BUT 6 TaxID=1193011 RepID=S3UZG0_9LEPT|nr:MORN repeat protein [Leptospira fainei]EPG74588.1 MORN repeat protein [Leptospira fainei serovar Hurstbridge str. BUT 6]
MKGTESLVRVRCEDNFIKGKESGHSGRRFFSLFPPLVLISFLIMGLLFLTACGKPKPKTNSEIERLKPKNKADDRELDPDLSSREYFDEDAQGKPLEKKVSPTSPSPDLYSFSKKGPGCKRGDCKRGEGVYVYESRDVYSGRFANEQRDGWGILAYSDGDKYEGNWSRDLKLGQGTYTFRDGSVFSGLFSGDGNGRGQYRKSGKTYKCRLENRKVLCK